jgi:uncharacterized protein YhjY with autotransporter beta-barrel domain
MRSDDRGNFSRIPSVRRRRLAARFVLIAGLSIFMVPAWTQSLPSGALTDPRLYSSFNALEKSAAIANQATFNVLTPLCTQVGAGQCIGATADVYTNVRELVQTGEEILTGTDRQYGLNLDTEGLGFALRWTAAEELLAQGSSAKDFANKQTNVLGSRIGAIRAISRSRLFAANVVDDALKNGYASTDGVAETTSESGWSRLGVFFDASNGYGDKADTTFSGQFEDAFDFDGYEYTLGADYRISNNLVVGGLVGYTDRYVDFNSSQSIVDGYIKSRGYSLIAFAQWDQMWFYASGSLGYQKLDFDTFRKISYPSFDPNVQSTNTATAGSTSSSAFLATLNVGVPYQWKAFGADLYASMDYQNLGINAFSENEVAIQGSLGSGFQFNVASQNANSLDTALGLKLQAVWTPSFGVFIPFVRGEYHRELITDPRKLNTVYAGLPGSANSAIQQAVDFALQSDKPDNDYYTITVGISAVIRGSSRVSAGGRSSGGLQGYLQYMKVEDLDNYNDTVISGGLRYEF